MDQRYIRNFSIIAHIDHGKSTLADRFLELTGALQAREMEAQVLDAMDLERERGITIKAHPVRLNYTADDGEQYVLNLIDTPGTSTSATRSRGRWRPAKGALLLVDASQGVEAQTLANAYLAVDNSLEIIPVINKIDLPSAEPDECKRQIEDIIGLDSTTAILASAKEGIGTRDILEAIVTRFHPPTGDPDAPLKALIFDSWYDPYRGVVIVVRVIDGVIRPKMKIRLMAAGRTTRWTSSACSRPRPSRSTELGVGEVGFMVANIKRVADAKIGDTITEMARPTTEPFPGFKELKPMVFAGLYPVEGHEYPELREALEKLRLNDASFFYEPESSTALGFGFRCGFLGLLHMEIVQERLEREYNMDLITTAPGVLYRVTTTDGEVQEIDSPAKLPDAGPHRQARRAGHHGDDPHAVRPRRRHPAAVPGQARHPEEARVPEVGPRPDHLRAAAQRGGARLLRQAEDAVARATRRWTTMSPAIWESPLVKMDILVNGEPVDALSIIVHRDAAYDRGRALAAKMRRLIPRQMFEVAIQASIGNRVIARESVKALRKNVLAKCYGGDISRKRKLLEKQKEGKKRMKRVGRVEIPQEAFLAALKLGED